MPVAVSADSEIRDRPLGVSVRHSAVDAVSARRAAAQPSPLITRHTSLVTASSGQAMVETALVVPLLLMLVLNVINFAYFFLVAINLAAAPRSGALYSILGFATPQYLILPPATSDASCPGTTPNCDVSDLVYGDMTGAIYEPATKASVEVCSSTIGVTGGGTSSQTSACNPTTYAAEVDPEAPNFILNRVDVTYTFNSLIPGTPFNIALMASPICTAAGTCTFHRMAEMREMN